MSDSNPSSESGSQYPVDAENAAEMARLTKQARLHIDSVGLLPEAMTFPRGSHLLDIGCGPGVWALEVAQLAPESEIVGLDFSKLMVNYACSCAQSQGLTNVSFQVHDARQPFPYPNHTFDYIGLSFATSYLSPANWPILLQECLRVLRPGGTFCSTEGEGLGIVTTPALAHCFTLLVEGMRQLGLTFTKEGPLFGIIAVQRSLLAQAGFQQIQSKLLSMDYSAGTPANAAFYDDYRTALKLTQPLIIGCGLSSQEELDLLYEQAMAEMRLKDFCGLALGQTVWGRKAF